MILLYIIGFIGNIDFLKLEISLSDSEIALLPIAVGMLVGFISERIINSNLNNKIIKLPYCISECNCGAKQIENDQSVL